jgi:hypothetical protein
MRLAVCVAVIVASGLLAGCPIDNGGTGECETDGDCSGNVCARDHMCYPSASVRPVSVSWTIRGMAASPTTCTGAPDLEIAFRGPGPSEHLGYAPVPCETGQFFIDKLPRSYNEVELGRENGFGSTKSIPSSGDVAFDLQL